MSESIINKREEVVEKEITPKNGIVALFGIILAFVVCIAVFVFSIYYLPVRYTWY